MPADGDVVLITGASRGMGRELAIRLAATGARVVVNFKRDAAAAAQVVEAISGAGGEAVAIQADVAEEAAVDELFEAITERFGRLDVLVANAAASAFKPLSDIREHHVTKTMDITVTGFLRLVHAAMPLIPAGGRVLGVSGWDSFRMLPGHGLLGAAKAAMEALIRYLAVELGPKGINVVGICPGPFDTDSFRIYAGNDWDLFERHWLDYSPKGRFADPGEIAAVAAFLVSSDAAWITGQTIVVDGGLSLTTMPLREDPR